MLTRSVSLASHLFNTIENYIERCSPINSILATFAVTLWAQQHYFDTGNADDISPKTMAAGMAAVALVARKTSQAYRSWNTKEIKKKMLGNVVHVVEKIPYFGHKLQAEVEKEVAKKLNKFKAEVDTARSEWKVIHELPGEGMTDAEIRQRFEKLNSHYRPGKLSGGVYSQYDKKLLELLKEVWAQTALTNPMHSEWPLINLMEAEVISMCQNLFRGKSGAPGIITHGGTTSIFEACYAYISYARDVKGIEKPEIIIPDTAHVSFDKAAKRFNVNLIKVPVDKLTGKADVQAMEKAITPRTCLIVGSAPSFPKGVMDPIVELGALAIRHHLPLHVDACLGGFITAFANDAGKHLAPCDFSVAGVTSISADTHKYGQAPKGTSVLLFNENCKATPAHVHLGWTGGMYVTPSADGSRSGADIALVWAVLCYKGKNGYVDDTRKILALSQELITKTKSIEGLEVQFDPELMVFAIRGTNSINSLLVASHLKKLGWTINILQTADQKPDGFHFCITSLHANLYGFADCFIENLKSAVQYAKENPKAKPEGLAGIYGSLTYVPSFIENKVGLGYISILNTLPKKSAVENKPHTENKEQKNDLMKRII